MTTTKNICFLIIAGGEQMKLSMADVFSLGEFVHLDSVKGAGGLTWHRKSTADQLHDYVYNSWRWEK